MAFARAVQTAVNLVVCLVVQMAGLSAIQLDLTKAVLMVVLMGFLKVGLLVDLRVLFVADM